MLFSGGMAEISMEMAINLETIRPATTVDMAQEAQNMRHLREIHPEAHRISDSPRKSENQNRSINFSVTKSASEPSEPHSR